MDMKISISIFINKITPQKLVLVPGAIIRGNTVSNTSTISDVTCERNLSKEVISKSYHRWLCFLASFSDGFYSG